MSRISKAGVLKNIPAIVTVLSLAALSGMALAAPDRYTLKLGKLSFSDFKDTKTGGMSRSARPKRS
jgi:hypothetical protein